MPNDIVSSVISAEQQAETIKESAKQDARKIIADAQSEVALRLKKAELSCQAERRRELDEAAKIADEHYEKAVGASRAQADALIDGLRAKAESAGKAEAESILSGDC